MLKWRILARAVEESKRTWIFLERQEKEALHKNGLEREGRDSRIYGYIWEHKSEKRLKTSGLGDTIVYLIHPEDKASHEEDWMLWKHNNQKQVLVIWIVENGHKLSVVQVLNTLLFTVSKITEPFPPCSSKTHSESFPDGKTGVSCDENIYPTLHASTPHKQNSLPTPD